MTVSTRRRPGPEQDSLRQAIVAAVKDLHVQGGYDAVTMRAVAQAVGVSAMALYRYYPNKGALLQAAWQDVLSEAASVAMAEAERRRTPQTRLRALYASYIDFWRAHPQAYRMVFDVRAASEGTDYFVGGPAEEFRQTAQRLVNACLPDHLDDEARHTAHALCRCKVLGYLHLAIALSHPGPNLQALQEAVLDDIARQLAQAKPAPPGPKAALRR